MARSSLKSSEDKLYSDGINGFNVFQLERFVDNSYIPPVYVTGIRLSYLSGEQEVKKLPQLRKPIYMADEIALSYENNNFTIHFAALSCEDPVRNRYSHILKGVDKEWTTNSENNSASYTNLPPGEYEFEVSGLNNDHQWNEKTIILRAMITPPWRRSSFVYFIYTLLLMGWIVWIAWCWNLHMKHRYKYRMKKYQIVKGQEVYKSKIGFFVNLVHETRTPLSLIRPLLEKLQKVEREGKEARYLSVIDKNVNYLLEITNQLLDFQKTENGALRLNLVSCDAKEIVNDVYSRFTSSAELKGIELVLTLPEQELVSMIDREELSRILVGPMGNAIKYTRIRIDLKLVTTDAGYRTYMSDDGRGAPDTQKEKIFEALYRMPDDKVATATGTGIGLALAKSLAEAHQGSLRLEDNEPQGSSFILSPPLNEKKVEEAADIVGVHSENEGSAENIPSELSGKKFTALLVEDNVELLNLTCDSLIAWFRVSKAPNGHAALGILEQESVDVIVSDVMMLEMNRLEPCSKVKSEIDYPHIPVILPTAKMTLESKVEELECGADVYIEKPSSIKQLHKQIRNLLRLRQSLHKLTASLSGNANQAPAELAMTQGDCEFVTKIQEAIADQLADENFSIDIPAEQMNMSRSNFYRKVKTLSGMSPNGYLKAPRMNKATELIQGGIRISEAVAQVGFTSSPYFAKCFKAQYGVLLKEYVNQLSASSTAVESTPDADSTI